MAASTQRQRGDLPRLNIPPVLASLALQQPGMQPLYSPALPTSLQHSFQPPLPLVGHGAMQTPMQPFFNPAQMVPPGAPGRFGHRAGQQSMNIHMGNMGSMSQLAAAGIHPPSGFPITPMGGHFPRQSMAGLSGNMPLPNHPFPNHPFPNRNRRQLSIGGPPKAVLGGPQRKLSPNPPVPSGIGSAGISGSTTPVGPPPSSAPAVKAKKLIVNLPKETIPSDEEGVAATKAHFARVPLRPEEIVNTPDLRYPEITTCEEFPAEHYRHLIPPTVDVFLPGKVAWERLKHADIEQKLEKLGVERGGSSSANSFAQPQALHGRAASVSSPADPALLFFKLNKLQQAQQSSSLGNSLSTSPQPPFLNPPHSTSGVSPSPTNSFHIPRFITNRHGHSLSLVQPPSAGVRSSPGLFRTPSTGATSNPFGPNAVLGNDQNTFGGSVSPSLPEVDYAMDSNIYAPQGRKPVVISTLVSSESSALAPPLSAVRTDSRPDFARGFGLDIPQETEEEGLEEEEIKVPTWAQRRDVADQEDMESQLEAGGDDDPDDKSLEDRELEETESNGLLTASQSRHHSRHASRLSAALSLRSFGGLVAEGLSDRLAGMHSASESVSLALPPTSSATGIRPFGAGRGQVPLNIPLKDRELEEWTGSEDVDGYGHVDEEEEDSDEESIGEWSNPSDEERARQARVEARLRRRSMVPPSEQPRKLPQFPLPPENTFIIPRLMHTREEDIISNPSEEGHGDYLGLDLRYPPSGSSTSRPLPPVPGPGRHSRGPSSQSGIHSVHDPARAHSRAPSVEPDEDVQLPKPYLNPKAEPFVFGARRSSTSGFSFNGVLPNAPVLSHSRLPSSSNSTGFASKLNATAAEFRPGDGFSFRAPFPTPNIASTATPVFPVPNPVFPEPRHQLDRRPLPLPPLALNTSSDMTGKDFVLNAMEGSPFRVQGREKRQRRDHSMSGSEAEFVEGDSMASFRFPSNLGSPLSFRRDAPSSPRRNDHDRGQSSHTSGSRFSASLNPTAEPFTFAGFASAVGTLPHIEGYAGKEEIPPREDEETLETDDEDKENNAELGVEDLFTLPTYTKAKRAPIPLTFKQTITSNTVPAGLFKALANHSNSNSADERTRPAVRSRLSSREHRPREFGREVERERERDFYEQGSRPSLDDLGVDMPAISKKASRTRLVTDPARFVPSDVSPTEDVFAPTSLRQAHAHARRRSSLPDNIENLRYERRTSNSSYESMSEVSSLAGPVAKDLHARLEIKRYEDRLENLLDQRLTALVRDLKAAISSTSFQQQGLTPKAEEMISDVVSLFRTQLADSAARGLDESHLDARGEMDFELMKDVMEQGHTKIMELMTRELNTFQSQAYSRTGSENRPQFDLSKAFEHHSSRTINAVVEAISELSTRLETIARGAPSREHDQLVDAIVSALNPAFNAIRPEVVDYEFLTGKLTQAVKPHISQIIDLASDKRETAGLIIDRLLPVLLPILQQFSNPALDTDAIALKLTTEVRRAIAPIDAFEIKEQVADLVVERLDSRLAVRDKSFNVDAVVSKITESVSRLLDSWMVNLTNITDGQKSLAEQQSGLSSAHQDLRELVATLPTRVHESFETQRVELLRELEKQTVSDQSVFEIKESLGVIQQGLAGHTTELLQISQDVLSKVAALPESISSAITVLQTSHSDFILTRDQTRRELEDLRRSNTDLQVQLHKARGAHGQIRVEKDMLNEKLNILETERERLRAQAKELQVVVDLKTTEIAHVEGKNTNLEEALAKALGRLQASDVATQANMDRSAALEKTNAELMTEKQSLKLKVDSLDLKATFAARDKENAENTYSSLQKQFEQLSSQQKHWDDLRHTSEQIEHLTNLIGQADNEELNELRRVRDRSKILEGEHAALQKRFKEQENRTLAAEKAATSLRQSLIQAQARALEWEKRSKENEGKLERITTQLEQAEQTHSQLDADFLVVKMQLEDREADERLAKDRETRLREEVSALENKTRQLQVELENANFSLRNPTPGSHPRASNGSIYAVSRPESRSSTVFIDRSATPNGRAPSTGSITPPHNSTSVWDSIHAPLATPAKNGRYGTKNTVHAPSGRYPQTLSRGPSRPPLPYSIPSIASPTPSTVSLAPTVDEEGWWS
ncbi:hypothetical protein DFJ43DRAFT_1158596 [Lentinula guzmanii]|uniref:Uncharacterized protein n=1 Tax=Lentinula guzmanii TaxID=2804957 RepID=A0AA38JJL8_9AGAR|nr:hypothetical protein DFJ43DRAFT_1158596 [Lentinula guzmanii]